jgi:hypothetical protein
VSILKKLLVLIVALIVAGFLGAKVGVSDVEAMTRGQFLCRAECRGRLVTCNGRGGCIPTDWNRHETCEQHGRACADMYRNCLQRCK